MIEVENGIKITGDYTGQFGKTLEHMFEVFQCSHLSTTP